jgi:glycopeptide antibiotics resistance protein
VRDDITRPLGAAKPRARTGAPARTRTGEHRIRVGIAASLLLLYVAVVLLMTMSATPPDHEYGSTIGRILHALHRHGVPGWIEYTQLEFVANIVMFLPLGLLVGLALPRRSAWFALLILPAFSGAIELTQAVLLSQRYATVQDVLANSIGGWIGLLIVLMVRARTDARQRKAPRRGGGI